MALDSATKRRAVPGVARPWMRSQVPLATPDREWRASAANAYPVANFAAPGGFDDALLTIYGSQLTGGLNTTKGGMQT